MEAVLHEDKLLTFGGGAPDLITEFREVFNRIMCLLSCIFPLLRPSLYLFYTQKRFKSQFTVSSLWGLIVIFFDFYVCEVFAFVIICCLRRRTVCF